MRKVVALILGVCAIIVGTCQAQTDPKEDLAFRFSRKYGQVEVGGNYAGAEFHHSRPLPSRISFYYPVANSIDLSTDYWKRGDSEPFKLFVDVDGRTDTIGTKPCGYSWTPYEAYFTDNRGGYKVGISYQFCDDIPFMVVKMEFTNLSKANKTFHVRTSLSTVLRTCQTYAWKDTAEVAYVHAGSAYIANFKYLDTDSASVIVVNAGSTIPMKAKGETSEKIESDPMARFNYSENIKPSGKFTIVQLIGSCRMAESREMVEKALHSWKESIRKNNQRILNYVYHGAVIKVPDNNLEHTALWSKAILATDRHYINGSIVPMPCPAEYNFFFTHDVLLTDLGAVYYDLARVKRDLVFIRSLTHADSILPHAYYWRDDGFKTEFATPDNWNHLWFMIVCGTYLKHSDDASTLRLMYPILKKSAEMTLSNLGPGGLAYSTRPDWWDIGNNYGARSYLTALMVRALREYCYVALKLGMDENFAANCLCISDTLQKNLAARLWNSKVGYLLNTLDTDFVDYHYYAGSLVAVDFDVLDRDKSDSLMATAQRELLDNKLGIRNAMPDDFDNLASLYRFKVEEVGGPFIYMNGAVWPQTTAWYILALIQLNRVNEAREALDKYLSIGGIENSPNGQPSFFEYRFSDPSSPLYGKIDKPNFLWAGGWYLNSLYHLVGVRENEWNIYLVPHVPSGFDNMEYDLTSDGSVYRVDWKGRGKYFKEIVVNGKNSHSAVVYGKGKHISVERGVPASPYLESALCVVKDVNYAESSNTLDMQVRGLTGQEACMTVVSPVPIKKVILGKRDLTSEVSSKKRDGLYTISLTFSFDRENERAYFVF